MERKKRKHFWIFLGVLGCIALFIGLRCWEERIDRQKEALLNKLIMMDEYAERIEAQQSLIVSSKGSGEYKRDKYYKIIFENIEGISQALPEFEQSYENASDEIRQKVINYLECFRVKNVWQYRPEKTVEAETDKLKKMYLYDTPEKVTVDILDKYEKTANKFNANQKKESERITCEVSGCGKRGTHSIKGLSGRIEHYCDEHFTEMESMYNYMVNGK